MSDDQDWRERIRRIIAANPPFRCHHFEDGNRVPCPPMCPYGDWPRHWFRLTFFRGRPVLRRSWRSVEEMA